MEIERKFLVNSDYDIYEIVAGKRYDLIADYYFNENTRLRYLNDKMFVTTKSLGTIEREEYEFEIKPVTLGLSPLLRKTRYYVPYKEHTFEVNIYNSYLAMAEINHSPLKLVEVELKNKNEEIELPPWVGDEVTNNAIFYNRNLFKFLNNFLV